ncbi:hypothetical protein ACFVWG_20470 [Kribbella sp. NPDC058245]|uniref:hypothetical protein n=1 Tax=Kribbella sp. NPDC058245 TaxID=3346399 RepID=UPI0036F02DAF
MNRSYLLAVPLATAALVAGCSGSGSATPSPSVPEATTSSAPPTTAPSTPQPSTTAPPKPVATESNPPGDIPDNQAFVAFQGAGFSVKVPEGWARSTAGKVTSFTDKLNRIEIAPASSATAATPQTVTSQVVPQLQRSVPKFSLGKVSQVDRAAGAAVLLTYQGDSSADPVTGKVVRDAFERYAFHHGGLELVLTLSGPTNADNVDPWKIVSDSVRWK